MNTEREDEPDFLRPRTWAGLAMFALIIVLSLMDALRADYTFEAIPLGLIAGTGGVLLGVPLFARLLR